MARRFRGILFIGLVGIGLLLAVLWRMTWMKPAWYAPPAPDDVIAEATAEDVEYAIVEQAHKIRPVDEVWSASLDEQEINAWLATRLAEWAAHHADSGLMERVDRPQVRILEDGILLAAAVKEDSAMRILRVKFHARLEESQFYVGIDEFGLGRLRMPGAPAAAVLDRLDEILPDDAPLRDTMDEVATLLRGETPLDPTVELDDGRVVRLEGFKLIEGRIDLTCRTLLGGQ